MYQIQTPPPGTVIGTTTLAAAITSKTQTVIDITTLSITVGQYTTVTSANPQWGFLIDGELMRVVNPNPVVASAVSVARGCSGTAATLHANGAKIWAAPLNWLPPVNPLMTGDPQRYLRYYSPPSTMGMNNFAVLGTSSTVAANGNNSYYIALDVPQAMVATQLANLNGTTASTNNSAMALYGPDGVLIATTNQVTVSGANAFQNHNFSPGPIYLSAGRYFAAYQQNGNTATPMLVPGGMAFEGLACNTQNSAGNNTITWLNQINIPTVFNNNTGPWVFIS